MTIQGDITELTLLELADLKKLLKKLLDNPYFSNTQQLLDAVGAQMINDPRYCKGLDYLNVALNNGLEDGYAQPSDYYFAVYQPAHLPEERLLLLCFKCDWWVNGEVYLPSKNNVRCRNFNEFDIDDEHYDSYSPEYYTESVEEIKAWFTKQGMEEKPELIGFYEQFLANRK